MDMSENPTARMAKPPVELRGEVRLDEPMARHVSWRAGGRVTRAYVPADVDDLCAFVAAVPATEPLVFVGLGSNLLVRDDGFRGTVIFTHGVLKEIRVEGRAIYAEAGVPSPKLARFAANHARRGAEFMAGIPGTIGGALAMNAGCYGSETWEHVEQVRTIDRNGALHTRVPADYVIGYRPGAPVEPGEEWVVQAWMRFTPGAPAAARERIRELLEKRIATKPLNLPNAGSVFRNPTGDHAARLVEACGLKGHAIGGARISEKHANFIVNPERRASAADIEALIAHARATVLARHGVDLVPEVRIIGVTAREGEME